MLNYLPESFTMNLAIQVLVVVMMVSVGLELQPANLFRGRNRFRWLTAGMAINLIAVPVGAWYLVTFYQLSAGVATGLLIVAAAPGGPVGPLLARLGKADVGYATSLMVLLGFAGMITTPLTISLQLAEGTQSLWLPMLKILLLYQILPLVAAMCVRFGMPEVALRLVRPARMAANLLLVSIVGFFLIARNDMFSTVPLEVHVGIATVLLLIMTPAFFRAGGSRRLRGLASITAFRNLSVALLIASQFFNDPAVHATILIAGFWMILVPAISGLLVGHFLTNTTLHAPNLPTLKN